MDRREQARHDGPIRYRQALIQHPTVRVTERQASYPAHMVEPTPTDSQASVDLGSLDLLAAEIRDATDPIEQERLYELADRLGVNLSHVVLRAELKARFPEVQYVRRAFCWRDDTAASNTDVHSPSDTATALAELLEAWTAATTQDDRARLTLRIGEAVASGSLSDSEITLARGVGAVEGEATWNLIPLDGSLSIPIIMRLAERAPSAWLIDAATTLPARAADAPKRRLQDLSVLERNEIAAHAIDRWTSSPSPDADTPGRVRRLRAAVGDEFTPLLVTNALSAARRIVETNGEEDESLQSLAALASLLSAAEPAMVAAGVDRAFDDREPMRRWLKALAAGGKNSSDRAKLISAIAATQIQSAIFDSAVYDGLDIKALGELLSEPHLSELLGRGLADHVRAPVKQATPAKVGKALAAVADFPVLEPLVPVDYLAKRLESNEPSSRLARAVAGAIVEEAVREERELAEAQRDALREQLTAARAEAASARQLAEQAEERAAAADLRWRQALGASAGAHDAQLRQAQIDALRAWADHIEDDRSVAATIEQPELLERQLNAAIRRIQSFAVKVEGQPGEHVAFDPKRHEPLDLDPGTTVEVITPAYMLADSATPLRYGLVRQIPVVD